MNLRITYIFAVLLGSAFLLFEGCGSGDGSVSQECLKVREDVSSSARSTFEVPLNQYSAAESVLKNVLKNGMNAMTNTEDRIVVLRGLREVFTSVRLERSDYQEERRMINRFFRLNLTVAEFIWRNTENPDEVVSFWETLKRRMNEELARCENEMETAKRNGDNKRWSDFYSLKLEYAHGIGWSTNRVIADEMIKYGFFNFSREEFQVLAKRIGWALDYKPERDFDVLGQSFPQLKYKLEGMVYGLQVVTNTSAVKGPRTQTN